MKLESVYDRDDAARVLFDLLSEREPHVNISHKKMPTFEEHLQFLKRRTYLAHYLIIDDAAPAERAPQAVGAIYLSKQREIGLFIFKAHQGRGFGKAALAALAWRHPGKFRANIAPTNPRSRKFFEAAGFRHIQDTLEFSPK